MAENTYLAVIGVPSIKKYVFGTDRLKEIRGASALLDHLNREETRRFLVNHVNVSEKDIVFLGGGAGQFFISGDKESVKQSLRELEKRFADGTKGGVRLLWEIAEYNKDYKKARKTADILSEKKRDESPVVSCAQLHTGFVRGCESCAEMAVSLVKVDEKQVPMCGVCKEKLRFEREIKQPGSEKGIWKEFLHFLEKKKIAKTERPDTFEKIGKMCSAKPGYTALVYADGNAMGKLISEINDDGQFRFFSKTVDDAIKEACFEALHEIFWKTGAPKELPADILLLGGDDLVVYMTAESALPFAIRAAELFREKTKHRFGSSEYPYLKDKIGENGLTVSLGIAYGKSHTPFSILMEQAGELLKSAKKAGSEDKRSGPYYSPAYVDFHLSTAFNQIDIADCRANHLEQPAMGKKKKIVFYRKPYSLEDAKALLGHARNLREKAIPGTRLKRFGNAPVLGKVNGSLECLKLYTRTPKGEKRLAIWDALEAFDCVENMPWNETNDNYDTTVIVDLMEIADFCERNSGAHHAP